MLIVVMDYGRNMSSNRLIDIFDSLPYYNTHTKAMVIKVEENEGYLINENFELITISWTSDYKWARQTVSINQLGKIPNNFFVRSFILII